MRTSTCGRRADCWACVVLLALLSATTTDARRPDATQAAASLDWWAINKAVVDQLQTEDIGAIVTSLPQASNDAGTLLREFVILVRAGIGLLLVL